MANRKVKNRSNATEFDAFPVYAGEHIYQGTLVSLRAADETLVEGGNTASTIGVGVARTEADNTNGSSGDERATVYTSGEFSLPVSGSAAYGDTVYQASATQVAVSGSLSTQGIFVGVALEEDEEISGNRWIRLGQAKSGL